MNDSSEMSLLEHLEELRGMLLRVIAAVLLLVLPGYFAAAPLLRLLLQQCLPPGIEALHYFTPMEAFMAELKLGVVLAVVGAAPYAMLQLWRFLVPALHQWEKRWIKWCAVASSALFVAGALFCCVMVLPGVMRFSASFASPEMVPMLGVGAFLNFCGSMLLAFGVTFQLPLAVLFAVASGAVEARTIAGFRPYFAVGILVLAALLTPPDVVSQVMLFLPAWLLFEAGLLASRWVGRQKKDAPSTSEGAVPLDDCYKMNQEEEE